jgi:hypothetical protein
MLTSIAGYITVAKAGMDWGLIGIELVGIFVGSMVGPRTQKYIPDKVLKIIFIILALYVGLGYFSQGFFGQKCGQLIGVFFQRSGGRGKRFSKPAQIGGDDVKIRFDVRQKSSPDAGIEREAVNE